MVISILSLPYATSTPVSTTLPYQCETVEGNYKVFLSLSPCTTAQIISRIASQDITALPATELCRYQCLAGVTVA